MRNKYNYKLQDCYICHAYAEVFLKSKNIFEENLNNIFKVDKSITIISPMNKSCYNRSYLVKQCELNNVQLLKSEKLFNISINDWSNLFKIEGIIEMLEKTTTEFAVVLDGKDTCIIKDLDESFIEEFKKYNADIVYNSMPHRYPNVAIESREFIEANNFKYINAGLCIGYTNKLLQFYKECLANINDVMLGYDKKPSEQYVIRKTVVSSNIIIKCDYNNILFNCPK